MRTTLVLDALRMALHQRRQAPTSRSCTTPTPAANTPRIDYTQTLDDHGVLGSIGTVGDAYDNAVAESFVDSFKTELIADRTWATRSQLELAVVEYVAWFNNDPPARIPRRPATPRDRGTLRCERQANERGSLKIGNLQTPSPRNPGRLSRRRPEGQGGLDHKGSPSSGFAGVGGHSGDVDW